MAGGIMAFAGFPRECVTFLSDLRDNNNKSWFEQHRAIYDNSVIAPSRDFVAALGTRLRTISPGVNADPRVNKSLFKIHRDTRFSPDKTPFKSHIGIMFWEGTRPRMECSCYYFHIEPDRIYLGVGIYMFPKPHLEAYRKSVVHERHGAELVQTLQAMETFGYEIGASKSKRVPRGFDPEHENAGLLLYKGLHAGFSEQLPPVLYRPELVDFCFEHYGRLAPLHNWLVAMTERL
jgi:uncharacterized protein (TIGR02453 family)